MSSLDLPDGLESSSSSSSSSSLDMPDGDDGPSDAFLSSLDNIDDIDTSSSNPSVSRELKSISTLVDEFLKEETLADRKFQVNRILKSFKLNPVEILALSVKHIDNQSEINKTYRSLSLLVHPDKCEGFKEDAQKAFAIITAAKETMSDISKRTNLLQISIQAIDHVKNPSKYISQKSKKKKMKTSSDNNNSNIDTSTLTLKGVNENDINFDDVVTAEMKEIIIEREWKRRLLLKQQEREVAEELKRKEDAKKAREEFEKNQKQWEDGREKRVNSWRDFQKGGKKRPLTMPKVVNTDSDKTYVRRAAGATPTSANTAAAKPPPVHHQPTK